MRFIKWLVIVVVLCLGVVFLVGYRLPKAHTAMRERELPYPVDKVFTVVTSPAAYAKWRTGVQKVEFLPDSEKIKRFKEIAMSGEVTYAIDENVPNKLFVTRIAQAGLQYGGSWTFEFEPTQKGTMVRITEEGEVYSPLFRFVSRYIIKPTGSIDRYLTDLDKRLASGMTDVQ